MLPVIIFLHIAIIERKTLARSFVIELWPYAAPMALYVPLRLSVLGGHIGPQSQMFQNISGFETFLAMMEAGFHYIRLSLFPTDLRVAYIFPPPGSIFEPQVVIFIATVAVTILAARRYYKDAPLPVFLILWFFLTLMPVSNIVPTEVIMTERALYLPSAAFCILMGFVLAKAYAANRTVGLAVVLAIAVSFASLVVDRTPVWGSERLFQQELLTINLGLVEDFPDQPAAYTKLADSYVVLGELKEAGPLYERALELDPADCGAHYGLANSLKNAGRLDDALDELYYALDCGYDLPADIHGNIAAILFEMGNLSESEMQLLTAIEFDPYEPRHRVNLGYILQKRGDLAGAVESTLMAANMDGANFESRFRLGMLYGETGDFHSAVRWFKEAVVLSPDNTDARFYLGAAYEASGNIESAEREYASIIEKAPGHEAAGARLDILKNR
jgi:tetratricopeptide (TPR) repeat protein